MKMNKRFPIQKINTSLLLIGITFLLSCSGEKTIFEKYHQFPNLSWNRFEFVKFEVPVEDVSVAYDIFLTLRHIPEMQFSELEFNITMFLSEEEMRSADYTLELFDSDGKRLSNCLGDLCDITMPLRQGFYFSEPGTVNFEIENKFTKMELPGMMKVGLLVKKAAK
jgi:gliding motility-associated lipoprotein GldH